MERFKLLSQAVSAYLLKNSSLSYWFLSLFYHKFISFFFYIKWCYAWNSYSVPLLPHHRHIFTTGALPCVLLWGLGLSFSSATQQYGAAKDTSAWDTIELDLNPSSTPLFAVYPGRSHLTSLGFSFPLSLKWNYHHLSHRVMIKILWDSAFKCIYGIQETGG